MTQFNQPEHPLGRTPPQGVLTKDDKGEGYHRDRDRLESTLEAWRADGGCFRAAQGCSPVPSHPISSVSLLPFPAVPTSLLKG